MSRHLYAGLAGRIRWFARRFGWSELILKPVRTTLGPVILPWLPPSTFTWRGLELRCLFARYNMTWVGERMIEVPIGQCLLKEAKPGRTLEIGNVLSHYFPVNHTVLDKYEKAPGVINADIIDYRPEQAFDLILSISTFEHIGFDDDAPESSGTKISACVQHTRTLLSAEGRLFLTFPTGYNPDLDQLLASRALDARRMDCYRRLGRRHWESCNLEQAFEHPYRSRYPYANSLVIAEFARLDASRPYPPAFSK